MRKVINAAVATALLATVSIGLAGCASGSSIDASKFHAVIDVRTPAEYASGHLQGAINIDVENPSFISEIETLPKADDYLLYCHSGRRAGLAIDAMKQDGFTGNLVNAGGYADASAATGLSIVNN